MRPRIATIDRKNAMGFLARQEDPGHRPAQQPLHRLRHRQGDAARGRGARFHLPGRTDQGARRRAGSRVRQPAGAALRRRQRRGDRRAVRRARRSTGTASTASCIRSRSRRAKRSPATFSSGDAARRSASRTTSAPTASPRSPKPALPMMEGRNGALLTLTYLGARALRAELQRDGAGQGEPGSQRALPGAEPRARRASA